MYKKTKEVKEKAWSWIKDYLIIPNNLIGNLPPCPYAKTAILNNQIKIISYQEEGNTKTIFEFLYDQITHWDNSKSVIVCVDIDKNPYSSLKIIMKCLNREFMQDDFIVLIDNPEDPFIVNGVNMTFPEYPLILIQKKSELQKATNDLKKTNYYSYWTQDQIDETITWRTANNR